MAPVFGYWFIRGFGESIRLMLHYVGEKYTYKAYPLGDPGKSLEERRKVWLSDKYNLGLDFPNLPYYIDGDVKITQSIAISRYLARKYQMGAQDEEEEILADMIEQYIQDARANFRHTVYSPIFEEDLKRYQADLTKILGILNGQLEGKQWLLGDRVTYLDFMGFEIAEWSRLLNSEIFQTFPHLVDYVQRFKDIPKMKEYFNSPDFREWPISAPIGQMGHFNPPEELRAKYPNYVIQS